MELRTNHQGAFLPYTLAYEWKSSVYFQVPDVESVLSIQMGRRRAGGLEIAFGGRKCAGDYEQHGTCFMCRIYERGTLDMAEGKCCPDA